MSGSRTPAVAHLVEVPAGTAAADAVAAGLPTTGPEAIVVVRDPTGRLRDLDWVPEVDTAVEPVAIGSRDGLAVLRHSTAHVLAQAVQDLFPEAKLGIGPPIENGFYYDFDVAQPFYPDDLDKIEKRMQEIVKAGQVFRRRRFASVEEARQELAAEPYKLELVDLNGDVGGGELTSYDNLDPKTGRRCWSDLCPGPHLPSTRHIPAFKLTRTSTAHWRGSERNPRLQRVYGTAWPTQDALSAYQTLLAEAARRDHRKIGADLDLFSFPKEIGSGLAVFHPKGGIIRRELEAHSHRRHEEAGYAFVSTPQGYADGTHPLDGSEYLLKPMNCPFHNLVYRSRGRSYWELPLRLFESGTVYQFEKSGVVHGLTRVRGMTQDDAHVYCAKEQMGAELVSLLRFVLDLLHDYGLDDLYLELSTKNSERRAGADAEWAQATQALRSVAEESGLELVLDPAGAAFYGPKISVQARDAIGRTWQMSTIQVDFQLPQRFGLEYQAADGSRQSPIMIHRALFGSIERLFGMLTEHYAGAFPAWLAPVQVAGVPIRSDHAGYLAAFAGRLRAAGIRVEVDDSDEPVQKKIRNAQQQQIPFTAVAGDADVAEGTVSFRYRDGSQRHGMPLHDAVAHVVEEVRSRINTGPTAAEPVLVHHGRDKGWPA